jgi:cellulose synthase/poly-beta-1,6-N-acetylglucosamine synthase-like glycosyltransferase
VCVCVCVCMHVCLVVSQKAGILFFLFDIVWTLPMYIVHSAEPAMTTGIFPGKVPLCYI